jgi:RND family efflux transporter MFP subunit
MTDTTDTNDTNDMHDTNANAKLSPTKVRRSRRRRTGIIVGVCVLIVAAAGGYYADRALAGDDSAGVQYVTQPAQTMTLSTSVSGTGNVTYSDPASVVPSVSGTVSGLSVVVGDAVTKGQTLFTLVDPQLDLNVTGAQDTLSQDKTAVVQAQLKVETDQQSLDTLRASSASTALQIRVAREQVVADGEAVTAAKAQVANAELALDQAKTAAADRKVTAPVDGTVTVVNVANGDEVTGSTSSASSAAALVITDTTQVEAVVSLAETDVANVQVGQKATLTFDALPNLTLTGKVTEVDASGTVNSGVVSYNVTIVPDTTNPAVKGGMTVSAAIITQVVPDALAVPNSAVKSQSGTSYVQILQNGLPVDQTVETGVSNSSYTQITSGLTAGQEVVTQTISNSTTKTTTAGASSILGGSSSRFGSAGFGGTAFGTGGGSARTTGGG